MTQSPEHEWLAKWWTERKQGIKLSTGIWLLLFLYCCFEAAYQRYKPLHEDNKSLQAQLDKLEEYRTNKEKYDHDLAWAKAEVRHWQDAYERAAKGETVPDRILSHEEENSLYDALYQLSRDSKNRAYATASFGGVQDREARHLWGSLDEIFRKAHWNVPLSSHIDKRAWAKLTDSAPMEIDIYSDDMSKGTFLMLALHNAAHLNSQALPISGLGIPNLKGTIIWVGYKQFP